ncbi:hypothetical protein CHPC973_001188 [Lactococcus phage CHPC973]|uniref:Uncharacterized protein n=1 Tax=Lactococcus phage CHPC973 TaxID=2675261 RepID=A0A650EU94_9CAUD|nr:hypothetical protein CHPC973_001188 [Lactococcus phage CHPC973]
MKIAKETLNALKNMPIITLNTIHDLLEVKQHINNYQRNTNKKYGLNLEKDEVINREVADMIIINKVRKAEKFAEKANLADKIVETLNFINGNAFIDINETALYNFVKKQNVQNLEYFSEEGRLEWFFSRVEWLLDTYKGE